MILRGMDHEESEVQEGERIIAVARARVLRNGDLPGKLTVLIEIGLCLLHKVRATKHLPATRDKGL